jgi:hypothetical protein
MIGGAKNPARPRFLYAPESTRAGFEPLPGCGIRVGNRRFQLRCIEGFGYLIGDGAFTERLKTDAVYLEESGSSWATPSSSPHRIRGFVSLHRPLAIGYWAIGYSQRASGELPLRAE